MRCIGCARAHAHARFSLAEPRAYFRRRPLEDEMIDNGSGRRQIEFPEKQTHVRSFEMAVLAISILCAIIVLVIVLFTGIGNEFRPTL
jgi:hypothetical protein